MIRLLWAVFMANLTKVAAIVGFILALLLALGLMQIPSSFNPVYFIIMILFAMLCELIDINYNMSVLSIMSKMAYIKHFGLVDPSDVVNATIGGNAENDTKET